MDSARFVGSIPENYDRGLGPHLFAGYAEDLARRVAALNPESVLELAAGTGIVSRRLRDHLGGDCELVASDLNEPMLEVAKAKFADGERVRFEQIDAMDIPYEDESFDVLTCQFGVMFFPDKGGSFREAARVLKPGGHYVFNVWGSWAANPFAQIAHDTVAKFFPDDPPGFYRVPFHYHDAGEIENELTAAALSSVQVQAVPLGVRISSAEDLATGLVFGNPLSQEIEDREGNADEICRAVARAIDRDLGAELRLEALVVCCSKA